MAFWGVLCVLALIAADGFRVIGWTDGQTDRQTEFSLLDRICIPCSAVKTGWSHA